MLNIQTVREGAGATVSLEGRLDTLSAPKLEKELETLLPEITELMLDFTKLEYLSSAGLRVLQETELTMEEQGTLTLRGVNETVMEIFQLTGFDALLRIVP